MRKYFSLLKTTCNYKKRMLVICQLRSLIFRNLCLARALVFAILAAETLTAGTLIAVTFAVAASDNCNCDSCNPDSFNSGSCSSDSSNINNQMNFATCSFSNCTILASIHALSILCSILNHLNLLYKILSYTLFRQFAQSYS